MTRSFDLGATLEHQGAQLARIWLNQLRSGKPPRRTLAALLIGMEGDMLRGACHTIEQALEAGHG
jgi:hypothetical protein